MIIDNKNYLTACRVSAKLNVSVKTLTNWYKWYKDDSEEKPKDTPILPDYIQDRPNGPRYWAKEDIPQLRKFRDWVPRGRNGVMGRINEVYWAKDRRNKKKDNRG